MRLIDDALELARFRIWTLEAYQYPFWQSALLLTLVGITSAASNEAVGFVAGAGTRMLFFIILTWAETLLFMVFIGGWMKHAGWERPAPLFGLIVLTYAPQLLTPLTSWLPPDVSQGLNFALSVYSILLLMRSLTLISGLSRGRVIAGILLFAPVSILVMSLMLSVGVSAGWIDLLADMAASVSSSSSSGDDGGSADDAALP